MKTAHASRRSTADAVRPVVVLVEPDPYLAFLIRLHVPEAEVVEASPGASGADISALNPSLVIVDADASPNPLPELLALPAAPKILAVVDGSRVTRPAITDVEGVLLRPFVPADLERAVRGALGLGARRDRMMRLDPLALRVRAMLGPARVIALVVTAVLEVGGTVSRERGLILGAAFVYVGLRWVLGRPSIVADGADVAVACALMAATGGLYSNYLTFGLVTTLSFGLAHGPIPGIVSGLLVISASTPDALWDVRLGTSSIREAVSWFILFPLTGATGGFASRVWRLREVEGANLLVEANKVLSSLYRIARSVPGGLEIGSVADATLSEIRDGLRASAALVLLAEAGSFVAVGSYGLRDPARISLARGDALSELMAGGTRSITAEELHEANRYALGDHPAWLAAPIRRDGVTIGALLAAIEDDATAAQRLMLARLADEAAVAVENARLFAQVREISIDEERRRLARELHDGVAQSLMHVRYELDFMARHTAEAGPAVQREIARLSRVVERASTDVRSMIMGLRSSIASEGLAGALRSYLRDLRSLGGPTILFDVRGEARVPPDIEAELFRIAQEAVSNAMRHAGARAIEVRLMAGVTMLKLTIEDDGMGITGDGHSSAPGGGVGLSAMRERAELIGARLDVGERPGGGTRVSVEYDAKERT